MSDIEILLRELIDKVDNLEKKIDRIEKYVTPQKFNVSFDLGDNSCKQFLKISEPRKVEQTSINPWEINGKCNIDEKKNIY